MSIPFIRTLDFAYGRADRVSPMIRRVVAENPSAFTFHGTGTYIVGTGKVAVIDPGPLDDAHFNALMRAVEGETVTHILVTHTHRDHSPLAARFKAATGAPTYGYGPHGGDSKAPRVEEGPDWDFTPDVVVKDGGIVAGEGWTFEAVHTPGHTSNHLCFALKEEKALFSGDHVMGWSTSVVSPPDGDMAAYFRSLHKLLDRDDDIYWPTHGAPIEDPKTHVRAFIAHREDRERQILELLKRGGRTIPEMVLSMYADVNPGLHRAAARSVLAHLVKMEEEGRIRADGPVGPDATYFAAG
ncbi:MAG: MBL fold metallo-hydrolase [Alphaproteobacteria bacterium]